MFIHKTKPSDTTRPLPSKKVRQVPLKYHGVGTTFWFDLAVFEERSVPEENQLLEVP